jgi:hypothetical protein
MLPYVIAYLALGAIISLVHPWIRGGMADLWRGKATGADVALKPLLGCLAFVIACVVWPIALRSAYKASKEPKDHFDRLLNDPHIRKINPLFHAMLQLSADGTDADEIPGAIGDFGLVATNPIPTTNIIGSRCYLDRLGTSDGQKVAYERRGSLVPDGARKPVDIYDLSTMQGKFVGTVYISPYHRKNSNKAPQGFRIR